MSMSSRLFSKGLFAHSCHPYHRDSHFPGIKLTSPGYAIGGHPLFTSVYISPNSALRKVSPKSGAVARGRLTSVSSKPAWATLVTPALKRQKQEKPEFKVIFSYTHWKFEAHLRHSLGRRNKHSLPISLFYSSS